MSTTAAAASSARILSGLRRGIFHAAVLSLALTGCGGEDAGISRTPAVENAEPASVSIPETPGKLGKGFDFYVLALSWSPSYCEAEGEDASRQQCESGRPYAFVIHGLWPQFERGYPADCPTPQRDVRREIVSEMLPLMPSGGLIRHQWRKHGSCAGLSQEDYFDVVRAARTRVSVPAEFERLSVHRTVRIEDVEEAFMAANVGLKAGGIAVTCDRRLLREVRICLNKSLEFRACPEVDRRDCSLESAVMPPVRGG